MQKLKTLYWVLVGCYGVGFIDGFLDLNLSDDLYILIGVVTIGALIWMGFVINKKQ